MNDHMDSSLPSRPMKQSNHCRSYSFESHVLSIQFACEYYFFPVIPKREDTSLLFVFLPEDIPGSFEIDRIISWLIVVFFFFSRLDLLPPLQKKTHTNFCLFFIHFLFQNENMNFVDLLFFLLLLLLIPILYFFVLYIRAWY